MNIPTQASRQSSIPAAKPPASQTCDLTRSGKRRRADRASNSCRMPAGPGYFVNGSVVGRDWPQELMYASRVMVMKHSRMKTTSAAGEATKDWPL